MRAGIDHPPLTLRAYRSITALATPLAGLWLKRRMRRGKEDPSRLGERRGDAAHDRAPGPLVWVHGASVGELVAVLPLIERIHARGIAVLVTSGTVTSAEVARRRLPDGVIHQFVPLDCPGFVERFFDHWSPSLALFVESDLWPNLLMATRRRRIPAALVNGRLSKTSFERWLRFPRTIAAMLAGFDICLVRTAQDAERFATLGARKVSVTGNIKLDAPPLAADDAKLAALSAAIAGRPVICAASTHSGEDEAVIAAHLRARENVPGLMTLIAPRHPHRGHDILALAQAQGLSGVLRSQNALPGRTTDIYVCDTLGELGTLYRVAPVVFMGGSLIPHGGQNPIEAGQLGAALLHGPHVANFADIYAALDQAGGAIEIADADALAAQIRLLLTDPAVRERLSQAAQATIGALGGGIAKTMAALEPNLAPLASARPAAAAARDIPLATS